MREGINIFATVSANDLPAQILLPPKNGMWDIGCLFFPSGVKKNEDLGSNLSGMNSLGYYH